MTTKMKSFKDKTGYTWVCSRCKKKITKVYCGCPGDEKGFSPLRVLK